jgi:hypothetical protein
MVIKMMPTIMNGTNGVIYQIFPPPMFAWTQPLPGTSLIGGTTYNIQPRLPGTQHYFPYPGPSVPFHATRNDQTINAVRKAVQEALSISGCMDSQRLFNYVNDLLVTMEHQRLDYLDMIKIMIIFVEEGWIITKVNSTDVIDWEWCKYTFHA